MDLVVCLALYSHSDFLNSSTLLKNMTFFYFRQTAPSLVSIAVLFMLIMGLAFVVCVCSFLYLQDSRHLNEMTTSLLVEIELDDQGSRVQYIQSNASFFLPGRRLHRIPCVSSRKKHFLRTLSQQRVQQNSYADNTPRDNSPPSLHHSISLAPPLCSLSFFFFFLYFSLPNMKISLGYPQKGGD